MKTYSTEFINYEDLELFLSLSEIKDSSSMMIQIFSSISEFSKLKKLTTYLTTHFKSSHIIGSTTDGEIYQGRVYENRIILVFTIFSHSNLKSKHYELKDDNEINIAQEIKKDLLSDKSKVLIAFADGLKCNGEEFIREFDDLKNLSVSGGLAADAGRFEKTYTIYNDQVKESSIVALVIDSDVLKVEVEHNFDWQTIGKEMIVTSSHKNIVYEIDGISAFKTYKKYLGSKTAHNLPKIGVEFPLIIQNDDLNVARAVLAKNKDGSLTFAGNIPENSKVRFGIGNAEQIINKSIENTIKLSKTKHEAIFIYSCMARKNFMQDAIENEISPLQNLASTNGFFTYGEFLTYNNKNVFLNETQTILALSESDFDGNEDIDLKKITLNENQHFVNTLEALTHLINVSTKEENILKEKLKKRVQIKSVELEESKKLFETIFKTANEGIWVIDTNKNTLRANSKLCTMLEYTFEELKGKNIFDFVDKRGKEIFKKNSLSTQTGEGGKHYEIELIKKSGDKLCSYLNTEAIRDENDNIIGSFAMISDIGDIKKAQEELNEFNALLEEKVADEVQKNRDKDSMMFKQLRLAQMGEMLSMIAHQWRQPLSTISAISTSMKLDILLGECSTQKAEQSIDKISEHVQFLSNTINDFRNFFNPNKEMIDCYLAEVIDQAISIVEPTFKSREIKIVKDIKYTDKIMMYPNEMIQMLLNLLTNAADVYRDKKDIEAIIEIKVYVENQHIYLCVEDNAGGIPDDIIEKIFDPYFSTKDEKNGTGLGLYMSKIIIEEHQKGSMKVENTSKGAKFIIKLNPS